MKWNTAYHIYEVLALTIIALSWWSWATDQSHYYTTHWRALGHSLEYSVQHAQMRTDRADARLREDVKRMGNSREGLDRIKRVELLRKRTKDVMMALQHTKEHLKKMPTNAYHQTSDWMIKKEIAQQTKQKLDQYVYWLSQEFKDLSLPKFDKLAEGNQENPLYYAREANKDFAHNYFDHTSPAEVIALLTQKQLTVKRYEEEVMKKLDSGCCCAYLSFDKFGAAVYAPLNTIEVGQEYTADMFINLLTGEFNPRMVAQNQPLIVRQDKANVAFKATKIGKQFWEGRFILKTRGDRDTSLIHRVPFEVLPK